MPQSRYIGKTFYCLYHKNLVRYNLFHYAYQMASNIRLLRVHSHFDDI